MDQRRTATKTVTVDEARQQFHDLLHQVETENVHVVIEENGESVAGLVSSEDLALLARLGPAWRERFEPLLRGWAAFSDEPPERIDEEIERAIAEVRRKNPVSQSA